MGMMREYASDEEARRATEIDCSNDEPLTKQEFVKDADINEIMRRCMRGGQLNMPAVDPAAFRDVSEIGDYSDAVRRIKAAETAFMGLPANVRSFFENNPANAVSFVQDPANLEKAIELGLAVRREGTLPPPGPETVPPKPAVEQIK